MLAGAVAHQMGELAGRDPAARRVDLDRVGIDAAHRPSRAAGDQRAADRGLPALAVALDVPARAGIRRDVGAGDRRRHGLALAELLERQHAAGAEVDAQRVLAGLEHELERAALGAEPAAGPAAQHEGHAVLGHDGLAVLPRQVEQRGLVGVEPGAGDRLDLGLGDRRELGLQPLVAFQGVGGDGVRQPPRIDAGEIGDDDHRQVGGRHAQELGAEARPQAAMADRLQAAHLADADAAAIVVGMAAGERRGGGELRGQGLAEHGIVEMPAPDQQVLDRRGETAFAALRIGVAGAAEARLVVAEIAGREVGDHGVDVGRQHGAGHAERLEDALLHHLAQLLLGQALDDVPEQQEVGVAVEEAAARREVEMAVARGSGEEIGRREPACRGRGRPAAAARGNRAGRWSCASSGRW